MERRRGSAFAIFERSYSGSTRSGLHGFSFRRNSSTGPKLRHKKRSETEPIPASAGAPATHRCLNPSTVTAPNHHHKIHVTTSGGSRWRLLARKVLGGPADEADTDRHRNGRSHEWPLQHESDLPDCNTPSKRPDV